MGEHDETTPLSGEQGEAAPSAQPAGESTGQPSGEPTQQPTASVPPVPPSVPSLPPQVPTAPPQPMQTIMCARCGQQPAVSSITARWIQSYGFWFQRRQSTAPLCAVCGHQVLDEASTRSMTRGLWGPAAAITSFITVGHNNEQRHVLPPVPTRVNGQRIRHPWYTRPLVYAALGGWVVVLAAILMFAFGVNLGGSGSSSADVVGTCWTSDQQAQQVACSNTKASDKVIGVVAKSSECEQFQTWDGYYLSLDGTKGYACLEKVSH